MIVVVRSRSCRAEEISWSLEFEFEVEGLGGEGTNSILELIT